MQYNQQMTWHTVTINPPDADLIRAGVYHLVWNEISHILYPYRLWCRTNLSSEGHLWRNESNTPEWRIFYFAQAQDAIAFRLAWA